MVTAKITQYIRPTLCSEAFAARRNENRYSESGMISTRDLTSLPNVDELRQLLQSLAMLDAILSPDWDGRYYSFNSKWARGQQMGSMRNGCGDDFFALFDAKGCFLKGFDHESPMSPHRGKTDAIWPGLFDTVPAEFAKCLTEPAIEIEHTTFCIWQLRGQAWQHGPVEFPKDDPDPDGSQDLLAHLDGRPETYGDWAKDYYYKDVDLDAVNHAYQQKPLTRAVIARLNDEVKLADLKDDIQEIGYPRAN